MIVGKAQERQRKIIGAVLVAAIATLAAQSPAADKLRVGNPAPSVFAFAAIEVGIQTQIFLNHGIDAQDVEFVGAAHEQQGLVAGNIDVALGSGLDMAGIVKGVPSKAVAVMYGAPRDLCVIVLPNSPIHDPSQLKGKTIAVSGPVSLTAWVAKELSNRQGWGPNGVALAGVGSLDAMAAQVFSGNADAAVYATGNAYLLQSQGRVRILTTMDTIVPNFLTHVIYASNDLIARDPDLLRRFLKGWLETIAFMKAHEDDTLRITDKLTQLTPELGRRVYREEMPLFSLDGRFDNNALEVVRRTFTDLALLNNPPDMNALYTEDFLPSR